MPSLARRAAHDGYTIFFLTGRPESQRAGTVANLVVRGLRRPRTPPTCSCATRTSALRRTCRVTPRRRTARPTSTSRLTRAHIEDLGYEIVANFGDQFSDLSLGHEKRATKLPNPMYFLP